MFRCSDEDQASFASTQLKVLSVVPLSVIPPPSAVTSVVPPVLNVVDPAVVWLTLATNTVEFVIDTILEAAPKLPAPVVFVKVIPGINPDVFPVVKVTVVVPVANVATNPVFAAPLPSSIFLSSTDIVDEFSVVVVPFTIRSPPTVTVLAKDAVPVTATVFAKVVAPVTATVFANVATPPT